jgi:hypothetical protein
MHDRYRVIRASLLSAAIGWGYKLNCKAPKLLCGSLITHHSNVIAAIVRTKQAVRDMFTYPCQVWVHIPEDNTRIGWTVCSLVLQDGFRPSLEIGSTNILECKE